MKNFTEEEIINAINQSIKTIKESAENENRQLYDFEKEAVNSVEQTLDKINKSSRHFKQIRQLAQDNYTEESIILTVTFFEILMRNLIKDMKNIWFYIPLSQFPKLTPEQKVLLQSKIQKYLKRNLYDKYTENLKKYQNRVLNPEIESLYDTLFDDNGCKCKINFQNLSEKNGVREAINFFFDIDISNGLNPDQKISQQKWILLQKLIKDRHDIVHCGNTATLSTDEIIDVLYSINTLTEFIYKKLRIYYSTILKQDSDNITQRIKQSKKSF